MSAKRPAFYPCASSPPITSSQIINANSVFRLQCLTVKLITGLFESMPLPHQTGNNILSIAFFLFALKMFCSDLSNTMHELRDKNEFKW